MTAQPRRFHLQRDTDITGVSGTGRVADGICWSDGTVSVRWLGDRPSTVFWDDLAHAEHIHGHGGHTRIVWDDHEQSPGNIETPAGHARNTALALVTALLNGDDEAAWTIARANDHDSPTLAMILARIVAKQTTPQAWQEIAMGIADGTN